MVGLKRWHLGALLPLLWFGYRVWNEWHYHQERETRFTSRTATEDWPASSSNRERPARTEVAPAQPDLPQAPRAAGIEPPLALATGLPVHSTQ
jgi:hypothetical protein